MKILQTIHFSHNSNYFFLLSSQSCENFRSFSTKVCKLKRQSTFIFLKNACCKNRSKHFCKSSHFKGNINGSNTILKNIILSCYRVCPYKLPPHDVFFNRHSQTDCVALSSGHRFSLCLKTGLFSTIATGVLWLFYFNNIQIKMYYHFKCSKSHVMVVVTFLQSTDHETLIVLQEISPNNTFQLMS